MIGMILAIFDVQVALILPTKFPVNWPFHSGDEGQNIQDGGHLGFPDGTILAILDLQVTPILPTKFWVSWPFCSGEEAQNRFSRWWPWRPNWISNQNDFSSFWSMIHPDTSYQVLSKLAQVCLFVCVEVLRPSHSNGVSLPLKPHFYWAGAQGCM